ncbi:MAG TPA: tyrosine-type recombinase/integrase [Chloroflexota bacterium]|nr:tyrosine-type recombinase/integrase [Chloroflexota bacterium]
MDTLTDEEIQRVLAGIDRTTAIGLRDYALIVTYLDTGARCTELLTLTMSDVHLDDGWLLLDGKGNKERMVRLGTTAKAALRLWLRQGRPVLAHEGCPMFFVDARSGGPLSTSAVEQRIADLGRRLLPGRRVYCHLLRHTFATNYLVYGLGDELHLMATLGHTTLAMTRQYVDKAKFLKALKERQGSVMDTLAGSRPRGRPKGSGMALWSAPRAG